MKTYYRHQLEILQMDMKIADFSIQKATWAEINDLSTVTFYQEKIDELEIQKETYLNQLFLTLHKTEINEFACIFAPYDTGRADAPLHIRNNIIAKTLESVAVTRTELTHPHLAFTRGEVCKLARNYRGNTRYI